MKKLLDTQGGVLLSSHSFEGSGQMKFGPGFHMNRSATGATAPGRRSMISRQWKTDFGKPPKEGDSDSIRSGRAGPEDG